MYSNINIVKRRKQWKGDINNAFANQITQLQTVLWYFKLLPVRTIHTGYLLRDTYHYDHIYENSCDAWKLSVFTILHCRQKTLSYWQSSPVFRSHDAFKSNTTAWTFCSSCVFKGRWISNNGHWIISTSRTSYRNWLVILAFIPCLTQVRITTSKHRRSLVGLYKHWIKISNYNENRQYRGQIKKTGCHAIVHRMQYDW